MSHVEVDDFESVKWKVDNNYVISSNRDMACCVH